MMCDHTAILYPGLDDHIIACDLPEDHAGLHNDPQVGPWHETDFEH